MTECYNETCLPFNESYHEVAKSGKFYKCPVNFDNENVHKVAVKNMPFSERIKALTWISNNVAGKFGEFIDFKNYPTYQIYFYFEYLEDAILFKLYNSN